MTKNWSVFPLGELCKLVNGDAYKDSDWSREGVRIVRIQNLNDHAKPFNCWAGSLDDRIRIDSGDVLLAWSGTPGTSFGTHLWTRGPAVLNQHIFRVDLDEGRMLPKWAVLAINQQLAVMISRAHGGVGLRHVTKREVETLQIPLPPLPEQKRIVRILDEAEELRRLRSEADRRTADLIPAIFYDMFSDPATNPRKWPRMKLLDVSRGKPNNGIFRKVEEYGSGLPVIWVEELFHDLSVDTSASRQLAATAEDVSKYGLKNGDLLFCRSSLVREGVGRIAFFDGKDNSALFECHLIRLSPDKALVVPEYVVTYFRLPFGRKRVMSQSRTATMTTVGQDDIAGLPLLVPPLPLQCTFAARVAEVRAMEVEQAQSRRRLDDLFQSLLHGFFAEAN